jgi:heparan-alpha-glucosaminide N-acetyltransferase
MSTATQASVAGAIRSSVPAQPPRNIAVDAYRGFGMLLMMGEVLQFWQVSHALPGNAFWGFLAFNQTHVEWAGCSLHDTIQPGFSFLVGTALAYSLASRIAKGQSTGKMFLHVLWRSLVLILLGVFLRSIHRPITYWTFEDTLSQIGFGYPFLFLLALRPRRWQWVALGGILFAYWLAWALYPLPGANFDYAAVGVPADWHHNFTGFAAHWNKNSNFGNAFDQWFLNLFPRVKPFVFNEGGYLTLSFIPTLGTMILGLIAGEWTRESAPRIPFRQYLTAAAGTIALALLFHFTGVCPIVKRIWTPSWTLFSGGLCFLFLAAFSWLIEYRGYRKWAFPLVVVGMNSIAAYLIAHLWEDFIASSFRTNLGPHFFEMLGATYAPLLEGIAMLAIYWAFLYWMYKHKLFLRV